MTGSSDDFEKAELEATLWTIKLKDEPDNPELQAEFENWLGESQLNADLYDDIQKTADVIDQVQPATREQWDEPWQDIPPKLELVKPIQPAPYSHPNASGQPTAPGFSLGQYLANWWKTYATVTIACCLLVFFAPGLQRYLQVQFQADYLTTTSEQRTITLDDGSQVYLAPESAISIEFSQNERHVRLIQGKAFFEVSPNPDRPFKVEAGDTLTTVLGTAFNVRLGEYGTVVMVEEGNVQVNDDSITPNVNEALLAGDRLTVTWREGAVRDQIRVDEVASWRQGELIARNMLMSDIVETLRTYHKGGIVIQYPAFSNRRVSGLYDLNDPEKMLDDLAATYGAEVQKITPWLLVVKESN